MKRPFGKRPPGRSVLLSFLVLLLAFLLLEGGLRAAKYFHDWVYPPQERSFSGKPHLLSPYRDKPWAEVLFREIEESGRVVFRPFVEWRRPEYHGNFVNVDSTGVRSTWNRDRRGTSPPEQIFFSGGSAVWGNGARDDYTIPSLFSKKLYGRNYDFRVSNHGEKGYTFAQEIIHLLLCLKDGERPKYVFSYHGANDVYAAYQSGGALGIQNFEQIRERLASRSDLWRIGEAIQNIIHKNSTIYAAGKKIFIVYGKQQPFTEAGSRLSREGLESLSMEIVKDYLKSMELLEYLSRAYDFRYFCFWQPVLFTEEFLTEEESKLDPRLQDRSLAFLYQRVNHLLGERRMPHFYNFAGVLKDRKKTCYTDFWHVTEEANEVIASRIFSIWTKEFGKKND